MVYKLQLHKTYKIHPMFPAVKLTKAKDNKWERLTPQVMLKVWNPATGEFIQMTEQKDIRGIKVLSDIFNKIPW